MEEIGKNEAISKKSLEKICNALTCNVEDISEIVNKSSHYSSPPTTIELFAGAGGLALEIEKAGFDTIALIEVDKDAANTLKYNRPKWNVICNDIANISCMDLEAFFNIKKGRA